ncbi:hypothetical protein CI109_103689 [Kwoniella shandongensis]|uniref:Uncharacterized protein n=1 Tax=Kwoniella shandongensis TaxID=1734106 RepID=A0A5M6CC99_9TREE|nr:uncharacterized protein CI109_000617 [Kwoniella shandongensis]KAA5531045.1 hypothetical protein CI109_000617 [Kwoniella shandongensis]
MSDLPRTNTIETVVSDHTTPSPDSIDSDPRERTYVDLTNLNDNEKVLQKTNNAEESSPDPSSPRDINAATRTQSRRSEVDGLTRIKTASGAEIKLTQKKKWFLLLVFSVAQYLDIASYSGLFVFTDAILNDLDIVYASSSWIITAYSVTFAAFLLFWGRVSDLYSAKPVFAYGFLLLGIINLIISFMTNKYAYFIFRALSGIAGAATIPSAFRLILAIFEPEELHVALTLFGLSGALANVTGLVLAGFFGFITAGGQQAAWRWFFRMITIIIVPFAFAAITLVPKTKGDHSDTCTPRDKFKRLDLVGSFSMLVAIILLILGLTLGASYGWKKAGFLVPFLLSWPIFVFFFLWEARLPEGYALIPPSFWKIPNMTLLIIFALGVYPWWATNQLPFVERFLTVDGETPIIAAVRMLPQGIAALLTAMVIPPLIQKLGNARWPIAVGMLLGAAAYLLMIYSDGEIHNNGYWRWYFPSFIIGSGGAMASFLGVNITVMTSVPPAASGVAGAMLQVALQVGAVLGLSVQAGLLTLNEGSIANFSNVQASFWFQFGWTVFNLLLIVFLFRPGKKAEGADAAEKGAVVAV